MSTKNAAAWRRLSWEVRPKWNRLATFGLAASALLLAACGSSDPDLFCPRLVVPQEADRISRFKGEGQDLTDVQFQAAIDAAITECEFDDGLIEVGMLVRLRVGRGPADEDRVADMTYFVAIAKEDRKILAREEFDIEVELPANQSLVETSEEINQVIPIRDGESGLEYFIFVGFALSPGELDYNRTRLQ